MRVSGLILAGGQGRRMGGQDKGWVMLNSKPMIEWVIMRLQMQVDDLKINANRTIDRYKNLNYPVLEDEVEGFQGPLAGILSGLKACENQFLVCVPCDTPFFPYNLVERLLETQQTTNAQVVSVTDGTRTHPVFALIKASMKHSLENYLLSGERKIDRWYEQHNYHLVEYSGAEDLFENINTEDQLKIAELRMNSNAK